MYYLCTRNPANCGNSSVGRAQPCQGWGREFEPRLLLQENKIKGHLRMTLNFEKYHPTGFNYMSVVLVHKVGFFLYIPYRKVLSICDDR